MSRTDFRQYMANWRLSKLQQRSRKTAKAKLPKLKRGESIFEVVLDDGETYLKIKAMTKSEARAKLKVKLNNHLDAMSPENQNYFILQKKLPKGIKLTCIRKG